MPKARKMMTIGAAATTSLLGAGLLLTNAYFKKPNKEHKQNIEQSHQEPQEIAKVESAFWKQVSQIQANNPDILFIISRNKNQNIVVYEAKRTENKQLAPENPVDVYWLDIDPEYVRANRKKGKLDDRVELGSLEKSLAYGVSSNNIPGKPGHYEIKLVAYKERPVIVYLDENKMAHAEMVINGTLSNIKSIYIQVSERIFELRPDVLYFDLKGIDKHGKVVEERVVPAK